ncbi:hypothetical protein GVAV_001724 [Gurleya vavrai]
MLAKIFIVYKKYKKSKKKKNKILKDRPYKKEIEDNQKKLDVKKNLDDAKDNSEISIENNLKKIDLKKNHNEIDFYKNLINESKNIRDTTFDEKNVLNDIRNIEDIKIVEDFETDNFCKKKSLNDKGNTLITKKETIKDADLQIKDADLQIEDADLQIKDADLQIKDADLQIKDADLQIKDFSKKNKLKNKQTKFNKFAMIKKSKKSKEANFKKSELEKQVKSLNRKKDNSKNQKKSFIKKINPYFYTTIPCAFTTAIDIGVSSYSLRTVSLAFYTMIKSSAPIFVLLSGFLFGIEKPSIKLFLVVFTIGAGVFLTTIKTDTLNQSFKMCMSKSTLNILFASFMAGFRWAFIQFLIQKKKHHKKKNVVLTIKELCLPIGIILFLFSLYFEGFFNIFKSEFFKDFKSINRSFLIIFASGFLSFMLLVSEFLLVSKTSVVFLSVSGIFKELTIVFISVCRKDIEFHAINYGGLLVSIIGMLFYNYIRMKR